MKKSIIILLLALLLTACGKDTTSNQNDNAQQTADTSTPVETELTHKIPQADYEGHIVTYLSGSDYAERSKLTAEQTGDVLDDAAYQRNLAISELLNVSFSAVGVENGKVSPTLLNAVAAGDTAYDLVLPHPSDGVASMVSQGLLLNQLSLPVVDFSMPWWNQSCMDALTLNGATYYSASDSTITWQGLQVVIFNKEYLTNYNIEENLYDTVRDGKWVFDKMLALGELTAMDLNGDGKMTGEDQFGILAVNKNSHFYQIACDQPVMTRDETGYPVLAMNTERMIDIVSKYHDMVYADYTWMDIYNISNYGTSNFRQIMIEGRSFMTHLDIGGLFPYLRELEFEFGILPFPKLNEEQKEYKVFCGAGIMGVPVNTDNPERIGSVLEGLAYYSYKILRPVFFDVVLENKTLRDTDSYEMLSLIYDARTFEFGYHFDATGQSYGMMTEVVLGKKSKDFASHYASVEPAVTSYFTEFIAAFEANS